MLVKTTAANNRNKSNHSAATNNKAVKLNNQSSAEDALQVFNQIKAELTHVINSLSTLKRDVIKSEVVESSAKSRLRITIESLLIDLNEEIYTISEDLAKCYSVGENQQTRQLISKARKYEHRKTKMIRAVY